MADAYLVDTGVFLRWLVDQDGFEHAHEIQEAFIHGAVGLETVDFAGSSSQRSSARRASSPNDSARIPSSLLFASSMTLACWSTALTFTGYKH